jgi:hypothetical protein
MVDTQPVAFYVLGRRRKQVQVCEKSSQGRKLLVECQPSRHSSPRLLPVAAGDCSNFGMRVFGGHKRIGLFVKQFYIKDFFRIIANIDLLDSSKDVRYSYWYCKSGWIRLGNPAGDQTFRPLD